MFGFKRWRHPGTCAVPKCRPTQNPFVMVQRSSEHLTVPSIWTVNHNLVEIWFMVKQEIEKKIRLAYARRLSDDTGIAIHTAHRWIKQYDYRAEDYIVRYMVEDGRCEDEVRSWYQSMRNQFMVKNELRQRIHEHITRKHGKNAVLRALGS